MALIKCLSLHPWMTEDWTIEDCLPSGRYPEIKPILNRPGLYCAHLYGGAWFETWYRGELRAYTYPRSQFEFDLDCMHAAELDHRKVAALQHVVSEKLATKAQRRLLYHVTAAAGCRAVYRSSRKQLMRLRIGEGA